MNNHKPRILAIGAHPDDCELTTGGTCLLHTALGSTVKYVSLTNGDAGHHLQTGKMLSDRRAAEFAASCAIGGFEHEVFDIPDGYLAPTHETRDRLIRLIRGFRPDLVFLPRTNDYHPDHRAAGQLVQDTAYLLMVPNLCPDVPALDFNPVMMHVSDRFEKPVPFTPTLAVDIDAVHETKMRLSWLSGLLDVWEGDTATRFRSLLVKRYGAGKAAGVRHAEAFELCEYGGRLTEERMMMLFPWERDARAE